MRIMKLHLVLCIMLLCVCRSYSQGISVSAPSQVAVGENFRIAYTVNTQDVDDFRAGNIPAGIEVIAGPYQSVQRSIQMINGRTSSSSSITFTYTLYAEKKGTYTIPSAHAKVDGKSISSKAVKITVSGTSANTNGAPRMHDESEPMRPSGSHISGKDLFVKVSANKRRVYEQEPILLTYKVYTLVDLTQLDGKMPDLTGFHTQEIKLPLQKSYHIEKVNGINYRCVTWSQYVMYPQMTGKLQIPSITFKGIVVQQNRAVDPFEAFFNGGSGYVEVKRNIVAPAIDIQVDPLPKKPVGFSGGVGSFKISANADNKSIKAGDPLTVRVVVSGVGNMKLLKQPSVAFPKDFDKYDPKVTDNTKLTEKGIEGSIIYDFLVVPRNQGKYVIPPVNFTYYDLNEKKYKTIKTQPINVNVAKGTGRGGGIVNYSDDVEDDIRGIKTGSTSLRQLGQFFYGSVSYWSCIALLIILFVVLLVVFRKRAIDNADIVKMKGRRANRVAVKRLRNAEKLMKSGRQNEFYDEVLRALWGYVSDKLNMPVERLSRDNISYNLKNNEIKESTINKFMSALDECEFERYAPGDIAGNMSKTYDSAMNAIMDIENSLKTSKHRKKTNMSIILLLMLFPLSLSAVTKEQVDDAYSKGNYQKAIVGYNELLKKGVSAELYYNLGNAYYRTGDNTKAIIAYERALRLSPGDNDVLFNLQFVRNKTVDKIMPRSEMFFVTWYKSLVNSVGVDTWAVLSVLFVIIALVLTLLFLFGDRIIFRKLGFYGAIAFLILFIFSNVFAYQQKMQFENRDEAIVVMSVVNVKNTPAESGSDSFTLHEGTNVRIIDKTMKDWRHIELPDGRDGWVRENQIEEI